MRDRRRVSEATTSSSGSGARAVFGVAALGELADQERKQRRPATESLDICLSDALLQRGGLLVWPAGPRFGVRGGGGRAGSESATLRPRPIFGRWRPWGLWKSRPGATLVGLSGRSATRAVRKTLLFEGSLKKHSRVSLGFPPAGWTLHWTVMRTSCARSRDVRAS